MVMVGSTPESIVHVVICQVGSHDRSRLTQLAVVRPLLHLSALLGLLGRELANSKPSFLQTLQTRP
jgi:hypothetical protein